ncbi:MAG: ABC transporter permease [Oceanospirillaceae bacterium]|nr:ABC transporter permease [Oceanospirillaceae bacterium]
MSAIWKVVKRNKKACSGVFILIVYVMIALFANAITDHKPSKRVARPHQEPSIEHIMGTTRMGRDVFTQFVHGTRTSLAVGFSAGFIIVILGTILGISAGYFGGKVDEVINFFTNIALVIPQLPLLLVLAAFLGQSSPTTIALIIGFTSWAWGARVTRAQTMALREKEYIQSAVLMGESRWRIILVELMPNLASIIGANFIGSVLYTVITQATIEFLGLGDPLATSWGTMLYNAQTTSAMHVGAWWELLVPAVAIAVLGMALALMNFALDEVSNPKLRTFSGLRIFNRRIAAIEYEKSLKLSERAA